MSALKNPYETLGVAEAASEQEIRRAYRQLALKHHPDRNPDCREAAEAKFKELTPAYDCLKDPIARAEVDRHLAEQRSQAEATRQFQEVMRKYRESQRSAPPVVVTPPPQPKIQNFTELAIKSTEGLPQKDRLGWMLAGLAADIFFSTR